MCRGFWKLLLEMNNVLNRKQKKEHDTPVYVIF